MKQFTSLDFSVKCKHFFIFSLMQDERLLQYKLSSTEILIEKFQKYQRENIQKAIFPRN